MVSGSVNSVQCIHLLRYVQTTSESHTITQRVEGQPLGSYTRSRPPATRSESEGGSLGGTHSTRYQPSDSGERGIHVSRSSPQWAGRSRRESCQSRRSCRSRRRHAIQGGSDGMQLWSVSDVYSWRSRAVWPLSSALPQYSQLSVAVGSTFSSIANRAN